MAEENQKQTEEEIIIDPIINLDPEILKFEVVLNPQLTKKELAEQAKKGRNFYLNYSVIHIAPKTDKEKITIYFFKPNNKRTNSLFLKKEYKKRNLKPCPLNAFLVFNIENQDFAKEYPNATEWEDPSGEYCISIFRDNNTGGVHSDEDDISLDNFYFAGVRIDD